MKYIKKWDNTNVEDCYSGVLNPGPDQRGDVL